MSEQKSIGHWDNSDFTRAYWQNVNNPPSGPPWPPPQPAPTFTLLSQLNEKSLADIRHIMREEIEAHDQRGLDRLMADIHRTEPLPEDEEIAAYLVTLSIEEWNALIEKVNERRYRE